MINLLKRKLEETMILKRDISSQQIKKDISLQLYYYLIEKPNFESVNITRALRSTLRFDAQTREKIFTTLCREYLSHIEKSTELQNRDDVYLKNRLINSRGYIDDIAKEIIRNPRMIQRMCQVDVEKMIEEIENKRTLDSSYMTGIAKQPIDIRPSIDTLISANKIYNGLKEHSDYSYAEEVFGYSKLTFDDKNGNPIEADLKYGPEAKRKNAIYEVGNMAGILNIGQKNDGQYKPSQEDSILLYEHPGNKKFKIAVVADDMGGMRKRR